METKRSIEEKIGRRRESTAKGLVGYDERKKTEAAIRFRELKMWLEDDKDDDGVLSLFLPLFSLLFPQKASVLSGDDTSRCKDECLRIVFSGFCYAQNFHLLMWLCVCFSWYLPVSS